MAPHELDACATMSEYMTPIIIVEQGYTLAHKKGSRHMCLRSRTYYYYYY